MSISRSPRYSVDLTDATVAAGRRIRGLGGTIPIDFNLDQGDESELAKWYRDRSNQVVRAMQLRREREAPYFHQFIVFELGDNCSLFRIDRRLRPDEDSPLSSLKDEGIPAFDTIESVVSWDDPLFVTSDCLIAIEFKVDVYLALVLKVCRQIQMHSLANKYTLQRYNCYFFAQTLISCVVCGASDWRGTGNLLPKATSERWSSENWWTTPNFNKCSPGSSTSFERPCVDHLEQYLTTIPSLAKDLVYHGNKLYALVKETIRFSWVIIHVERCRNCSQLRLAHNTPHLIRQAAYYARSLLEDNWIEGRNRLLAYGRTLMHGSIWDIEASNFVPQFIHPAPTPISTHSWPWKVLRLLEIRAQQCSQRESSLSIIEFVCRLINEELCKINKVQLKPFKKEYTRIVDTRLDSFKENMVIKINSKKFQDTPQDREWYHNPENIPRYIRARNRFFRYDRKIKQKRKQEVMVESSIVEMHEYLAGLVHTHSIRVEQYSWATKTDAATVFRDIIGAMDEIWNTLMI
ncbi:hypothetical protein OPQ81_007372 [Rhizoctonia solani]|nr:hypothetical protein OPQ81_007372 [Rhizoctonia solani]